LIKWERNDKREREREGEKEMEKKQNTSFYLEMN
jgi:hypothetical protein